MTLHNEGIPTVQSETDITKCCNALIEDGCTAISIVVINIDRFKTINELLGRGVGDMILNTLYAKVIDRACGNDGFHLWADSFALICAEHDEAVAISKEIVEDFSRAVNIKDYTVHIPISIGIATGNVNVDEGFDSGKLLSNAESAIDNSRRTSPKKISIYEKHIHSIKQNDIKIEHEMRDALANGEFIIHLQPKMNIMSELVGAEALVRWQHPDNGLLNPGMFIDIAEKSWLISDLTKEVYRQTVAAIERLNSEGIHISVAFNMSTRVLSGDESMVEFMRDEVKDVEIFKQIEMEIVETALLGSNKQTDDTINKICGMGIRIGLDDFGTGYSSYSYLHDIPASIVKIDRRFIKSLNEGHGRVITESMIDLAKKLDKTVVAEGVETKEQLEAVIEMGVDEIQGYYFSKPISIEDFIKKYSSS